MEYGPRLRTATAQEQLNNCVDCYQSILQKDQRAIWSGTKVVGYRHTTCTIPAYVKQKYPNAR